ncbi:LptM family lipoprotein [Pontibacillus marinus]|uniref:Lipoprotein n=1 Tax=Pontibacillus marinus BH030004 = DSM 16465 TaxID=1385511 RepID=A0A0A5GEP0_9BACI|nr:hypothetical protein [Pontibacillus marinus]KGX89580.1 hypothetical protein N783_05410 [Pontibacillus marinus BH030004 = DSM 16465]
MKKILSLLSVTALLFVLTACGQSAKETYVQAYQGFMDAKTYETSSTIDVNVQSEDMNNAPNAQMFLGLINNAEFQADVRVDTEKEMTEAVLNIKTSQGPMSFNLDVPMHINMKKQKVYIKTETIKQAMSMVPLLPVSPDFQFEKEYVALDASASTKNGDQKQLQEQYNKQMMDMIKSLSEDQFTKNENQIELNLKGKQVKDLIISLVESSIKENNQLPQGASKEDIEKSLEDVSFNKVSMQTTIEDNQLKKEEINMEMEASEAGQQGSIAVNVTNQFKSINESIEFTMNPTEENTMTQKQFEEKLNQLMMKSMMPTEQ